MKSGAFIPVAGALCLAVAAVPARAQYSQAIFLELVRDPGQADVARTARSLALAGIQSGSGTAEDAVVSPGSLLLATGSDVVASAGFFGYARNELVTTPRQLPPFDPARQLSERSRTPVAFVGAATRGEQWAVAGFYDATARYEHGFTTARSTLLSLSLFPTVVIYDGSGATSISHSVTRVGGSVAVGRAGSRAGVGVSVSLVRFNYTALATDTIEVRSSSFSDPVLRTRCCVIDQDGVEFRDWAPAVALSGVFAPFPHITLAARWRHEPAFASVRTLAIDHGNALSPPERFAQDVRVRLPGAYGVTVAFDSRRTILQAAVTRETYGGTFSPLMSATVDPNYVCASVVAGACEGWNFPYHDTKDITTIRAAAEQTVAAGAGRFAFRGGIAFLPGYTLARPATDVSTRRTLSFPAPPIVTDFEPPRESALMLSGGVAYAWRAAEVGFGIGGANHQRRVLVDLRLRSR